MPSPSGRTLVQLAMAYLMPQAITQGPVPEVFHLPTLPPHLSKVGGRQHWENLDLPEVPQPRALNRGTEMLHPPPTSEVLVFIHKDVP